MGGPSSTGKRQAPGAASPQEQSTPSTQTPAATPEPPRKRMKRHEYRAGAGNGAVNGTGAQDGAAAAAVEMPRKKYFRQRAHANPFSDHALKYPASPADMDWSAHFPGRPGAHVDIADIGCGFGGLLFALAPKLPEARILGLEIRTSVTEFVESKIRAVRYQQAQLAAGQDAPAAQLELPAEASEPPDSQDAGAASATKGRKATATQTQTVLAAAVPGAYNNISVLRANTMKFLPNFFPKASLQAIFLCFPDPHFKARKHKARIVSATLNAEYAHVLKPGGLVYTITDVQDLHEWMRDRFEAHPSFERVGDAEVAADELVQVMATETEEGKKVIRVGGNKLVAVFRRLADPPWPGEE